MCLSKYTLSRLVYELAKQPFYIEDLRHQLLLPSTAHYNTTLMELKEKKRHIWSDFYSTDAMSTTEWMQGGYDLRHIMTRLAVHGFHYMICQNKKFHQPDAECMCELCSELCDRYHNVSTSSFRHWVDGRHRSTPPIAITTQTNESPSSTTIQNNRDNGIRRIRYTKEIYNRYKDLEISVIVKLKKLEWAGHVQRMDNSSIPKMYIILSANDDDDNDDNDDDDDDDDYTKVRYVPRCSGAHGYG
ncbi:hypothetical protein ANN_18022 [Periplaneta americana]|uniref:Uncharacterized protein n=1 Tax=Periplaneta americana TaxID=6978 RepID=A0ABQ8SNY4_PERAM|nr:hypothetical protein ANN_18022 [Periplaneta americana]